MGWYDQDKRQLPNDSGLANNQRQGMPRVGQDGNLFDAPRAEQQGIAEADGSQEEQAQLWGALEDQDMVDVRHESERIVRGPEVADAARQLATLDEMTSDTQLLALASAMKNAIAFVHFDSGSPKSNMVEALIHYDDLTRVDRGMYVEIVCTRDQRRYTGRIVEGPFYDPDVLKRDSTPVQFIILNQGQGKLISLPEYHARVMVELLGEDRGGLLYGTVRRPHPASPVYPFEETKMATMLRIRGNIILGTLDAYDDVILRMDETAKEVLPRNIMTVGTVGSGKSNTNQVLIEETVRAGFAQVIIDPEGEYTLMDQAANREAIEQDLAPYGRSPEGVPHLTVYRPPRCESRRADAIEFSVPFDSLSPEMITEIAEMNENQRMRFVFLYDQAIKLLNKQRGGAQELGDADDADVARGYPGITLKLLLSMLSQELEHFDYVRATKQGEKRANSGRRKKAETDAETDADTPEAQEDLPASEKNFYCRRYELPPLLRDQQDLSSYRAVHKHLRHLQLARIFDRTDAPSLDMEKLSEPGHVSVIDMSDCDDTQVRNIVIADLLARMYRYKMGLNEADNRSRRVILTLEEAHGFVSRERKDAMKETLAQLQRIARRGRKRWLTLHFVTQSPQHLPPELFELANNKIIHQTTGTENLRVLKAAAGTINEGIWEDVPSLGMGRAIVVSPQYPHPIIAKIRPAASRRNFVE